MSATYALIGALVLLLFIINVPLPQNLGFMVGVLIIGLYAYGLVTSDMLDHLPAPPKLTWIEILSVFFGIAFMVLLILSRAVYLSITKKEDRPFMPPFWHVMGKCLLFAGTSTIVVYVMLKINDPSSKARFSYDYSISEYGN